MKRLEEIKARLNAATPGPWGIGWMSEIDERAEIVTQFKGQHPEPTSFVIGEISEHKNQVFVAHAPDDIAFLLAEIDRLRGALEGIEGGHDSLGEAAIVARQALSHSAAGSKKGEG